MKSMERTGILIFDMISHFDLDTSTLNKSMQMTNRKSRSPTQQLRINVSIFKLITLDVLPIISTCILLFSGSSIIIARIVEAWVSAHETQPTRQENQQAMEGGSRKKGTSLRSPYNVVFYCDFPPNRYPKCALASCFYLFLPVSTLSYLLFIVVQHCRYCHHHFDTGIFQTAQCSCKETVVVCCSVA